MSEIKRLFFSVFSNAADVNKKVLFARDEQSSVAGRCLFALSDTGGILTFQPYWYNRSLEFQHHVAGVASVLARRMGTAIIPRGQVSNLVSTAWYDDGSRDLCDRFPCLQDGSMFRDSLVNIELVALPSHVEETFSPLKINALSLSLLLELPEFDRRPELILPLLPHIDRSEGYTLELWHRIVVLSQKAGTVSFARKIVHRHVMPALLARYRKHRWFDESVALSVAEIAPSAAIRFMRQTRPRGVRKDEDEMYRGRRIVLATAYRILGRIKKADQLEKNL